MNYPLYCYRDSKANDFSPPICSVNEATAKRDFARRLHMDQSMGFAPSDYDLYYCGTFETENGSVEPIFPEFICNGSEVF